MHARRPSVRQDVRDVPSLNNTGHDSADLASVGDKSRGLLVAILDPNRPVEARYNQNYYATTKEALDLHGRVTAETGRA